jgi:hypothetical protein
MGTDPRHVQARSGEVALVHGVRHDAFGLGARVATRGSSFIDGLYSR